MLAPSSLTANVAALSPASPFSLTGSPSLKPLYEDEPKFILVFTPPIDSLSGMICLSPLSTLRFASPHHFQLTDFCYSLNISSLFGKTLALNLFFISKMEWILYG
ncbi:unnamed protein product [Camellia sinensis]